ncbi:protein GIGAS CELL1-like [Tasmannia lanceolata]|uniref:protein GIGAS CELL1-like n=1 Tax=Tasmannia lanceolata TaxID=3420 RepID=UPI0040639AD5
MPEARDRRPGGDLGLGFGIQRGFYVAGRLRNGHERTIIRTPPVGKENVPPESSSRRRTRPRKSPLPSWYPRTPLRDITSIVKAMERRRARLRGAARRNQEIVNSPPTTNPSPISPEPCIFEQTPVTETLNPDILDFPPNPVGELKIFSDPIESPLSNSVAVPDLNITPDEKKYFDFDEIELAVRVNSQRRMRPMPVKKSERSTLMSMR